MNENLKNALKSVKIDEKKLDCIIFYAEQKNKDFSALELLQGAVDQAIDKAFVKYVPKQVRIYINKEKGEKKDVKQSDNNEQNCSEFENQTNSERH